MKPDTRLLIRLTLPDGALKGWGYDYPDYNNEAFLREDIKSDFLEVPENTEIHLFYYVHDTIIEAKTGSELSKKTVDWLIEVGGYNGN